MKNFKYFVPKWIRIPFAKLKTMHDIIKQTDVDDIKVGSRNPYQALVDWFVEILQYGSIITFVYINIMIIDGWMKVVLFPISFGMIRWLWLDIVKNTNEAIKEHHG
jgi:hypothetical protein